MNTCKSGPAGVAVMMKMTSEYDRFKCFWVDPVRLEQCWIGDDQWIDDSCLFIETGELKGSLPHVNWVRVSSSSDGKMFILPKMRWNHGASQSLISFDGGRHRLRWMMSFGLKEIPVSIFQNDIQKVSELGIIIREVWEDEPLPVVLENAIEEKIKRLKEV